MIIGNYSAATSFSALIGFFMMPLNTTTFPLLSKLKPTDSVFEYVFQNIIKYEALIVFPITVGVIALSDHLIKLLYGPSYIIAPFFLQIFMLSYFFIGLGDSVTINLLNSQKETTVTLRKTLIYIFFGAPMGAFLIPRFGVVGFQITNIIAPQIGLIYALRWIRRNYKISVDYKSTFKIFFSSIIGFLSCKIITDLISMNLFIELVIGGSLMIFSYTGMILFTGALSKKNIEDINSITRKNKKFGNLIDPILGILLKLSRS